ncbi:ATP-binding protein [Streptomyces sp. RKAG290]|uniref:ATP-binding protein n=1 Tax=Streptomyces sp. RKAG290 TaxID=2888348 RepID=UPI0020346571|nr:ATP-binding protein [Streptomyces sp. RKAG290]MCM2412066.1 ATP-binding protein [Streptomyces sp. RKAG290]
MNSSPLTALCPAVGAETWSPAHPRPYLRPKTQPGSGLTLSFTLPGDARSAFVGRTAIAAALEAHSLAGFVWPTTQAVAELAAVAAGMSPGRELYVSLRHRDEAIRLLVWDQHPRHVEPDVAALCEVRRRRALWLLAAVVEDWGGEWGTCDAVQPQVGVKGWVVLPR